MCSACAGRYPGQYRNGYRQGRLVDRVGQLRQPFRAGGGRHCQARRRARCAKTGAHRRKPAEHRRSRISAFVGGQIGSKRNPDNKLSFSRVAGLSHWSPAALPDGVGQTIRETVFWSPPELAAPDEADQINSSLCHGFIFDFCGVEVDRTTLQTRIDRYVTMHDCGTILHPAMVDGQIRGGFAQALGAALYEEYAYAADGSFLTGTFADYLLPTTAEVPDPLILHMETPSPFTPLGAKGVGEGNCMSTPVCIANAVADALGATDLELPLLPAKLAEIVRGAETAPPAGRAAGDNREARRPATARRRRGDCWRASPAGLGHAARSRRRFRR